MCGVFCLIWTRGGEDSKKTPYPHETSAEITGFNLTILVAKERIAGSTGLPLGNTDGVIVVQEDQTVTWWAVQSSTAIILIQGILLNWYCLNKTVLDYNENYLRYSMYDSYVYSVCLFFSTLPTGKKVRKTRISSRIPTRIACDWAPRLWHTSKPRVWSLKTGLNVGGEDMQFTNWWMDAMMIFTRWYVMMLLYMKTRWFMILMHDDRWNDDGINIILMYGKWWYTN